MKKNLNSLRYTRGYYAERRQGADLIVLSPAGEVTP